MPGTCRPPRPASTGSSCSITKTRRSVPPALSHETSVAPTYADYQRHLHHQIHRLIGENRFDGVIVVNNRSVVAVQHDLRRLLHPHTALVPAECLSDVRVVALGGMSESGKSTAGEYLRTRHSHARLKIGYLIDDAAHRTGIDDPYALAPVVRAELLLDGLDRYAAAHHFLDRLTLESLHEFDVTTELRRVLGDQLSVAYIDTTAELRARRGRAGPADVTLRDTVKASRAHRRSSRSPTPWSTTTAPVWRWSATRFWPRPFDGRAAVIRQMGDDERCGLLRGLRLPVNPILIAQNLLAIRTVNRLPPGNTTHCLSQWQRPPLQANAQAQPHPGKVSLQPQSE